MVRQRPRLRFRSGSPACSRPQMRWLPCGPIVRENLPNAAGFPPQAGRLQRPLLPCLQRLASIRPSRGHRGGLQHAEAWRMGRRFIAAHPVAQKRPSRRGTDGGGMVAALHMDRLQRALRAQLVAVPPKAVAGPDQPPQPVQEAPCVHRRHERNHHSHAAAAGIRQA